MKYTSHQISSNSCLYYIFLRENHFQLLDKIRPALRESVCSFIRSTQISVHYSSLWFLMGPYDYLCSLRVSYGFLLYEVSYCPLWVLMVPQNLFCLLIFLSFLKVQQGFLGFLSISQGFFRISVSQGTSMFLRQWPRQEFELSGSLNFSGPQISQTLS